MKQLPATDREYEPNMPVTATVRFAPLPDIIPSAVSPFIRQLMHEEQLLDFCFDASAALIDPLRGPDAQQAFEAWRSSFEFVRQLGTVSAVEVFRRFVLDCAEEREEYLGELERLDVLYDVLDSDSASILRVELELARPWLIESSRQGWGLVDTGHVVTGGQPRRGLAAAGIDVSGAAVLSEVGESAIRWREGDGLFLVDNGAEHRVQKYRLSGSGMEVQTPEGPYSPSDDGARALARLAPGAAAVQVRNVPVTSVFARTLAGLHEAAGQAADNGLNLVVLAVPSLVEGN